MEIKKSYGTKTVEELRQMKTREAVRFLINLPKIDAPTHKEIGEILKKHNVHISSVVSKIKEEVRKSV